MTVPFNETLKLFTKFAPMPAVDPTTAVDDRLVYWAGHGMPVPLALALALAAGGAFPTPAMKLALSKRYREAFEAGMFTLADGRTDPDAEYLYDRVGKGRCVYGFFNNHVLVRFYNESQRPSDAEALVKLILSTE